MLVYLEQSDYLNLYNQLNKNHEVGGYFNLNGTRLIPVISTNGNYNSIQLNNSKQFLFHTHPGKCISKQNCSLGMPSSQDMIQFLDAALQGNIVHFVIAYEGLYVVQVNCNLLNEYKENKNLANQIRNNFKNFQNQFTQNNQNYSSFINSWINFANSQGFHILFYKHGSALQFQINNSC